MRTKEELIDEAVRRGIVPGVTVACAWNDELGVVAPLDTWIHTGGDRIRCGSDRKGDALFAFMNDRWATVITPAPVVEEEGLKEGDAVKTTPKMRDAIVELAKELGVLGQEYSGVFPNLLYKDGSMLVGCDGSDHGRKYITPESFIAKMRITTAKPKPEPPIKIKVGEGGHSGEWDVKHEKGRVKIGQCTYVDNATVKAIAEKLIDP